jgi:hypothetical protein
VVLLVEAPGVGEILDLAEHLDANTPMRGEIVFGAPTILEAQALGVPIGSDLTRARAAGATSLKSTA